MANRKQQRYVVNVRDKSANNADRTDVINVNEKENGSSVDNQSDMNLFGDIIASTPLHDERTSNTSELPIPQSQNNIQKVKHPRIVVAGCRDYLDTRHVEREMKKLVKKMTGCDIAADVEIVEGGARGVDTIARNVAEKHKWACREFKAQWCLYGRRAGPTRNAKMARYAAESEFPCLLAFWDMQSRGTGNMIRVAKKNGLDVTIIDISKKMRKE